MNTPDMNQPLVISNKKKNGWKLFGITVIVLAVIALIFFLLKAYLFPTHFKPVVLNEKETSALNQKLKSVNLPQITTEQSASAKNRNTSETLSPEAYSETAAKRDLTFSEKEINAMIAHNTDMADKLAIDLSDNLASAKLLLPLDPDMPMFGGKTLKLNAGVEISFHDSQPVVKLRGVSAWGVPIPAAWLGNMKNVDLVSQFGGEQGFWQAFSDGIDYVEIKEGKLHIKLKE